MSDWSLVGVAAMFVAWLGVRVGPTLWAWGKAKISPKPDACPTIHQVVDAYAVLLAALQAEGEAASADVLHSRILPAALPGPSSFEADE